MMMTRHTAVWLAILCLLIALLVSGCGKKPPVTPEPPRHVMQMVGVTNDVMDPTALEPFTVTVVSDEMPTAKVIQEGPDGFGGMCQVVLNTMSIAQGPNDQRINLPTWKVTWDGKDANGTQVADGRYQIEVTRKDGSTVLPVVIVKAGATHDITVREGVPTWAFDPTKDTPFEFAVTVPDGAGVKAVVRNSADKAVRTLKPSLIPETNNYMISWNGKTESGDTAKDGAYTIVLEGKAADGKTLTPAKVPLTVKSVVETPTSPSPPTGSKSSALIWEGENTTVAGKDLSFLAQAYQAVAV
jgi:flagellar hook assembly protein FlgD